MAITVEIDEPNAGEYVGFESIEVIRSMENFSGSFTIQAAPIDLTDPPDKVATKNLKTDWPVKINSKVKILVNEQPILTGYVESINIDYSANPDSHTFTITGRDKTADIIDSTCETFTLVAPTSLVKIAKEILKLLGITDIKIKVQEGLTIKPLAASDIASFPYGTSYFDILEEYAKKSQVLLTTDGDGNILFSRAITTNKFKTVLSTNPKTKNTIKKGSLAIDASKKFYKYIVKSMASDSSNVALAILGNDDSTNPTQQAIDDTVNRKSRIYNFISEVSCNQPTLKDRAKWEANFRQTQAKKYLYTVGLHTPPDDPKEIWKPNYLVDVQDIFGDGDNELLINSVTYRYNLSVGSEVDLELVQKNAFSLELAKLEKSTGANAEDDLNIFT